MPRETDYWLDNGGYSWLKNPYELTIDELKPQKKEIDNAVSTKTEPPKVKKIVPKNG